MRITESNLRRIIRSVILESVMFQYDEEDYYGMDELCRKLSMIFFALVDYKHDLYNPQKVINDNLIDEKRVNVSDVKMHIKKVGDFYVSLDVGYDFLNKLGYDDSIIKRVCNWGDNYLWVDCDSGRRVVNLGDPADI